MKKICVLGVLFLFPFILHAQLSCGGTPPSFANAFKSSVSVPILSVESPNMEQVKRQDDEADLTFKMYRIATLQPLKKDFLSVAHAQKIAGGTLWRLQINADGALAIGIYSDSFHIPTGGLLFVYNPEHTEVLGAFSSLNNNSEKVFAIDMIQGEQVCIEYFEPENTQEQLQFEITEIAYAYRGVENKNSLFNDSGSCNVNVACSEADNYRKEVDGVVRIFVRSRQGIGLCTGTLMNNTARNKSPLILTAAHCLDDDADKTQYTAQHVYRFRFQTDSCRVNTSYITLPYYTLTGSDLLAYDTTYGALGDFALLRLKDTVPNRYKPYFCGWDRRNIIPSNGVCIHHPSGDVKKVSTYKAAPSVLTYPNGHGVASHFRVFWNRTENGHGITEGGSSGSALFNNQRLVIGDLTGGQSSCSVSDGLKNDYYGRLAYNWDARGSNRSKLKPWLDPLGLDLEILQGMNMFGDMSVDSPAIATPETKEQICRIYPTLFKDHITIVFEQESANAVVELYNAIGEKCYEQTVARISKNAIEVIILPQLSSGMYWARIKTRNSVEVHRLVKN